MYEADITTVASTRMYCVTSQKTGLLLAYEEVWLQGKFPLQAENYLYEISVPTPRKHIPPVL
jgi:hypothetical protein